MEKPTKNEGLSFQEFHEKSDLTPLEIEEAFRLYQELFGNFALSFEEILEIVSDPTSINVLIKESRQNTSEEKDYVIGFCAGVPLSKFDLIPEKLRFLVKLMMSKSFFVLAIGISPTKESSTIHTLFRTYEELLERVVRAGYTSIYTLARATKPGKDTTMSEHLQTLAHATKLYRLNNFTPGEHFDLLRIGNLPALLQEIRDRKIRKAPAKHR